MSNISPSAIIHEGATIGENVEIGPFTLIGNNVKVGSGTKIGSHVVINGHTTLGKDNTIYSDAIIGSDPQDLKYQGEESYLEIGDGNKIRECVTINRGTEGGGGVTRIGNGNLLMAYVHIAHDCQLGNRTIFSNTATLAGHVEVGDGAVVSAATCIHQFVHIGALSMVAGGSMVSQDVAPYTTVQGDRAVMRGLNLIGLKRTGLSNEEIHKLKEAHRFLFRASLNVEEAEKQINEANIQSKEVDYLVNFVKSSKRGICRPSQS